MSWRSFKQGQGGSNGHITSSFDPIEDRLHDMLDDQDLPPPPPPEMDDDDVPAPPPPPDEDEGIPPPPDNEDDVEMDGGVQDEMAMAGLPTEFVSTHLQKVTGNIEIITGTLMPQRDYSAYLVKGKKKAIANAAKNRAPAKS
ncbi:hypothetical protein J8273_7018 [Carpediemonas membranifera]|uniref:Uncharacterized protein n=1 Tax=Carpediemonas membranifera TaxID=201153 RepID=A0A8J6AT28_9EUKA|nr:hypothetical protein J8273_7018 [Carpediemonas membranifera]|eukprot:KAG9390765.1 hypothetical protein J8273_7018 [Carpediemonas membranifera]